MGVNYLVHNNWSTKEKRGGVLMFPAEQTQKMMTRIFEKTKAEKIIWRQLPLGGKEDRFGPTIHFTASHDGLTMKVSKIQDEGYIGKSNYYLEVSDGKNTITLEYPYDDVFTLYQLVSGPCKQEREEMDRKWACEQTEKKSILERFIKVLN